MPRKFIYELPETVKAPDLPHNINQNAKWLAGEGQGSWFVLEMQNDNELLVQRFNKVGKLECEKVYRKLSGFQVDEDYLITFPSFCNKITVKQGERKFTILE